MFAAERRCSSPLSPPRPALGLRHPSPSSSCGTGSHPCTRISGPRYPRRPTSAPALARLDRLLLTLRSCRSCPSRNPSTPLTVRPSAVAVRGVHYAFAGMIRAGTRTRPSTCLLRPSNPGPAGARPPIGWPSVSLVTRTVTFPPVGGRLSREYRLADLPHTGSTSSRLRSATRNARPPCPSSVCSKSRCTEHPRLRAGVTILSVTITCKSSIYLCMFVNISENDRRTSMSYRFVTMS